MSIVCRGDSKYIIRKNIFNKYKYIFIYMYILIIIIIIISNITFLFLMSQGDNWCIFCTRLLCQLS